MRLSFSGDNMPDEKFLNLMKQAGDISLKNHGITAADAEVSVSFVNGEEIKELNKNFRGKDKVTDVLSFPQFEDTEDIKIASSQEIILLGDVVICEDTAKKQAEEFGHSYERELIYLFVHSMMHLLGYDHMEEEEKDKMRKAEETVLTKMGILRGENDE